MSSDLVSRRAVTRGVAWTVPLVAVAVAAPAFAASVVSGPVVSAGTDSCKCPGGGSPYLYYVDATFSTPGTDDWSVTITSVMFETTLQPFSPTAPSTNPQVLIGGNGTIRVQTNSTNSAGTHDVTIAYTSTNLTTNVTVSDSMTLLEVLFKPCKSPVVCA